MLPIKLTSAILTLIGAAFITLAITAATNWKTIASELETPAAGDPLESEDYIQALLAWRETTFSSDMPADATAMVKGYDQKASRIRREAATAIREERLSVLRSLKALQDRYMRDAALDQAVAIRDTILRLLEAGYPSIENPGTMSAYGNQIGKSFLVRVTGRTNGSIYGSEFFTYDSDVATACVHRGILKAGETGVVIIKIVSTNEPHQGSTKNGIRSYDYGIYPASYTVRRWRPTIEEVELGSLRLE